MSRGNRHRMIGLVTSFDHYLYRYKQDFYLFLDINIERHSHIPLYLTFLPYNQRSSFSFPLPHEGNLRRSLS
jgi:hypothetical protein